MTANSLNAALASHDAAGFADHAAARSVHCEELDGHSEEGQAAFYDQLAALIQAMETEHRHEQTSADEAGCDEPASLPALEPDPPEAFGTGEAWGEEPRDRPDALDPVLPLGPAVPLETSLKIARAAPLPGLPPVLTHRAFGVAAGLVASVAVGGIILAVAGGPEPTAIAGHDATTKYGARLIETVAAPVGPVETPFHARVPEPSGAEGAMTAVAQGVQDAVAEIDIERIATADDRTMTVAALARLSIAAEMSQEPVADAPDAAAAESDGAEHSRADGLPEAGSSGETARFETIVQTAAGDSETLTPDAARSGPAHEQDEAFRPAQVNRPVNMRAGPDNAEPVLAVVSGGASVKVVHCGHWCEVIFAGQRGWIYRSFISMTDADGVAVR